MKPIHALLFASLLLLPSCGSSSEPAKEAVELALSPDHAAGSPAHPLLLDARVRNLGLRAIWHYEGCTAGEGIRVDYYDASGNLLQTRDPYAPQPACADQVVPLALGGELESTSQFNGTLYRGDPNLADRRYPAPAGHYRAVATFGYFRDPALRRGEVVLAQSVEFDWTASD